MRIAQLVTVSMFLLMSAAGYSGTDSDSPQTSSTGIKFKGQIKIGVEAPLSGDQQTLGEGMLNGAKLAAEHINAAGGLNKKRIVIVPIDDAATSAVGIQAAKKAVKSKIKGVIGPYNSGVGIHTLPIYMKAGLLPIRLTSNNVTDGFGYTLQPMADEIAPMAADALVKWLKVETVGIIYDSTQNYTTDLATDLADRLTSAGVAVKAFNGIMPGATSYSTEVSELAALNCDVIYAATYFPEGGLIAKTMFEQEVPARCVVDYASDDPGFITVAGIEAAMATDVVGVPSPTDFPAGPAFAAEYESAFGTKPGTWSPYTYDSLNFLIDGVKSTRNRKFGKKRLKKVLDNVVDWQGVTGSVTINPVTGNRTPATLVILGVDANGQFVINKDWAEAVNAPY